MRTYGTSEIAKLLGVHPNTVMLYEKWGYTEPVARKANGYRVFTERHLEQMKLAQIALRSEIIKCSMRFEVREIIKSTARWELEKALELSQKYLKHIQAEKRCEQQALMQMGQILRNEQHAEKHLALSTSEAAKLMGVSSHILIYWENNGLLKAPRNKKNGHRIYTEKEIRLLKVIQVLRLAKYSMSAIYKMFYHAKTNGSKSVKEVIETLDLKEAEAFEDGRLLSSLAEAEEDAKELISCISELIEKQY